MRLYGRGVSRIYLEIGMVVIQSSELVDVFKFYEMRTRDCRVYAPHSACSARFTGFTMGTHVQQHRNMRIQLLCCVIE